VRQSATIFSAERWIRRRTDSRPVTPVLAISGRTVAPPRGTIGSERWRHQTGRCPSDMVKTIIILGLGMSDGVSASRDRSNVHPPSAPGRL